MPNGLYLPTKQPWGSPKFWFWHHIFVSNYSYPLPIELTPDTEIIYQSYYLELPSLPTRTQWSNGWMKKWVWRENTQRLVWDGCHCTVEIAPHTRLGKNKLHELLRVQLFKRFSGKFVNFPAEFGSLNVQIRNNFRNVNFIVCKWCKICKFKVYSMVISCNTGQLEKKNAFRLLFDLRSLLRFQICRDLRFFRQMCILKISEFTTKNVFFFKSEHTLVKDAFYT